MTSNNETYVSVLDYIVEQCFQDSKTFTACIDCNGEIGAKRSYFLQFCQKYLSKSAFTVCDDHGCMKYFHIFEHLEPVQKENKDYFIVTLNPFLASHDKNTVIGCIQHLISNLPDNE